MPLDDPLAASLKIVGTAMRAARDPWWIIASAAVALHGAGPGRIADVDVLLSPEDAARLLPTLGLTLEPGPDHDDFRSIIFATWSGAPLPVEFMAGFHHRSRETWRLVQPISRQPIAVEDTTLFVPEREELRRMLLDFGRPKDIERAARLAALG